MNQANYLGPYTGQPYTGRFIATALDHKTAQVLSIPLPPQNRMLLTRAALVGALVASLSGGATVQLEEWNPNVATAATLTTALAGANNDLVFTAKTAGTGGNAITVRYVDPATETATEAVAVVGTAITVTLRSVSSVLSTATQVKAAIDGNTAAAALVSVANASANTGAGAVIAMAATALTGGLADSLVQTLVASGALASSDETYNVQALTLSATANATQPGNLLKYTISAGATATTDQKDLLLEGTVL